MAVWSERNLRSFVARHAAMSSSSVPDPAEAVRRKQQLDAERLFERLQQIHLPDLTVNYTLENSSVTIPGLLVRLLTLSVLFRLNSPKKWHAALREQLLPESLRRWLGVEELTDLAERATLDWIEPRILLDTLSWQVAEGLTQLAMPQPVAVIRQTIRDLLLGDAQVSEGGIVLSRRFWRRSPRQCSHHQRRCSTDPPRRPSGPPLPGPDQGHPVETRLAALQR